MSLFEVHCLSRAYRVALDSPDPSTQNGAVIPYDGLDGKSFAEGCNTFPRGVKNLPERLERPQKYAWIEHAERNAIYDALWKGISVVGRTMYCPWFACADCARAIIQSGISRVVGHQPMFDATPPHWKDSIEIAFTMFEESGVQTKLIQGPMKVPSIRFNGELWSPNASV